MTIRAVLFDMYGTLGCEAGYTDFAEVLGQHGFAADVISSVRSIHDMDHLDGTEHYEHSLDEATYEAWRRGLLVEALLLNGAATHTVEELADLTNRWNLGFFDAMTPYPETVDVLHELRASGVLVAVCSNWEWDIEITIQAMGLTDLVDYVFTSARLGVRKPHPQFFSRVLEAMGIKPDEAVFVGDNWKSDILGARAAGLRAVWVNRVADNVHIEDPEIIDVPNLTAVLSCL